MLILTFTYSLDEETLVPENLPFYPIFPDIYFFLTWYANFTIHEMFTSSMLCLTVGYNFMNGEICKPKLFSKQYTGMQKSRKIVFFLI